MTPTAAACPRKAQAMAATRAKKWTRSARLASGDGDVAPPSRREGGATSPSPGASRALRVHFFALVAAIACAFLGHAAAVGVIAERKLALQRFEARLSAVMDSWHQLLM